MDAAIRIFFSQPSFAVVGASSDPSKYGHKGIAYPVVSFPITGWTDMATTTSVFVWYLQHSLPVQPINPRAASISVPLVQGSSPAAEYPTVPALSALSSPSSTAISIITPPSVTLKVLQEAKDLGVKAVWLQPGSYDEQGLKFAMEHFEGGVGGKEGLDDKPGEEGWCVLVDGEEGLKKAGREVHEGGKL